MPIHRYKLTISYDGTNYGGWQVQPNATSIQSLVQKAIQTILREEIDLTGATRTDSGVHAIEQTAHFDTPQNLSPESFLRSVNAVLPFDIRITHVIEVDHSFHARYSAKGKIYHYCIQRNSALNPFFRLYSWHYPYPLDIEKMTQAAAYLIGEKDFKAFANESHQGAASRNSIRRIDHISFKEENGLLTIEFQGNGFLYKMVRNIVGTLIDVGRGKLPAEAIPLILESKDRRKAGQAAPSHGLCLYKVLY